MSDWRSHAECRGVDTNVFFPDAPNSIAEARRICDRCTVSDDCLEFILSIGDEDDRVGVFAGTSARQRRQIRRERSIRPAMEHLPPHIPIPLRWDSETEMYLVNTEIR